MAETIEEARARIQTRAKVNFKGNALLNVSHLDYFKPLQTPDEVAERCLKFDEVITVNPLTGVVKVMGKMAISDTETARQRYREKYRVWTKDTTLQIPETEYHRTNKTVIVGKELATEAVDGEFRIFDFIPTIADKYFKDILSYNFQHKTPYVGYYSRDLMTVNSNGSTTSAGMSELYINNGKVRLNIRKPANVSVPENYKNVLPFISYEYEFTSTINPLEFYEKMVAGELWNTGVTEDFTQEKYTKKLSGVMKEQFIVEAWSETQKSSTFIVPSERMYTLKNGYYNTLDYRYNTPTFTADKDPFYVDPTDGQYKRLYIKLQELKTVPYDRVKIQFIKDGESDLAPTIGTQFTIFPTMNGWESNPLYYYNNLKLFNGTEYGLRHEFIPNNDNGDNVILYLSSIFNDETRITGNAPITNKIRQTVSDASDIFKTGNMRVIKTNGDEVSLTRNLSYRIRNLLVPELDKDVKTAIDNDNRQTKLYNDFLEYIAKKHALVNHNSYLNRDGWKVWGDWGHWVHAYLTGNGLIAWKTDGNGNPYNSYYNFNDNFMQPNTVLPLPQVSSDITFFTRNHPATYTISPIYTGRTIPETLYARFGNGGDTLYRYYTVLWDAILSFLPIVSHISVKLGNEEYFIPNINAYKNAILVKHVNSNEYVYVNNAMIADDFASVIKNRTNKISVNNYSSFVNAGMSQTASSGLYAIPRNLGSGVNWINLIGDPTTFKNIGAKYASQHTTPFMFVVSLILAHMPVTDLKDTLSDVLYLISDKWKGLVDGNLTAFSVDDEITFTIYYGITEIKTAYVTTDAKMLRNDISKLKILKSKYLVSNTDNDPLISQG